MIFIFTIILTYCFYRILSKKIHHQVACVIISYFVSGIIILLLTFQICLDGWVSSSIGSQGACSHHGGVTTKLNTLGLVLFCVCIFVVIVHIAQKIKSIGGAQLEKTEHKIQMPICEKKYVEQNVITKHHQGILSKR